MRNRKQKLVRFRCFVALSLVSHLIALSITLILLLTWFETPNSIILYFRGLILLRIVLLLLTLCYRIKKVEYLIGTHPGFKLVRHWSSIPPLWAWLLIGYLDWYLFMWTILIINVFVFMFKGPLDTFQFVAFFLHDIFYIIDYKLTFFFIYYLGIKYLNNKN